MTKYLISGNEIDANDPDLAAALTAIHGKKNRPLCLCKRPGIEMYVAKVENKYIIKRMPNTGNIHHINCDSYDPPEALSGMGQVAGRAIKEDPDSGVIALKFDFSMSKTGAKNAPVANGIESDTVKTDGTKLTLRSTLHYLWEEAGFNKWSPAMKGKRSWAVIRKYLLQAADNKTSKGVGIRDFLYIPEPFNLEQKDAIAQRRVAQLSKIKHVTGVKKLMISVAQVKEITTSRYGYKVIFKNLSDYHFMMEEDMYKRLCKRFATELSLWGANEDRLKLMMINTFSVDRAGIAYIEECAVMLVSENWIPFEDECDELLLNKATNENRRFTKSLRYNLPSTKPMASMVLTDVALAPVALYIVPAGAQEAYVSTMNELIEETKMASWIWDVTGADMSNLPV